MAIYTNLPVYRASYALLLSVSALLPRLPRDCRYSMGAELRNKLLEIIVLIYCANRTRQKVGTIRDMREALLVSQVYVRLMCDMHYISIAKYAELAELTADISKQMAAWEKSETNKYNDGQAAVPAT